MIQVPLAGWMAFLLLVGLSSALGIGIARHVPLSQDYRTAPMVRAFGLALAPFLLGLSSVVVLAALPGQSHTAHYLTVAGMLSGGALLAWLFGCPEAQRPVATGRYSWWLTVLIGAFITLLLFHAIAIPLTQSDSLEYSFAGRRLYWLRSLGGYPPVDPVGDPTGFYGPWTHPPLYPALIYLANVCQGNADTPGLLRLLSPWALLATAYLVATTASFVHRRMAQFSALFLFATPLLFLGADSALLDAFSACAVALAVVGCAFMDRGAPRQWVAIGATVGLGMWAHSQAVLLIPLVLFALVVKLGWRPSWRRLLAQSAVVVLAALTVGAWPYVANYLRAGVVISDNPAVFAMPELFWNSYFRSARDFDALPARIQYGIFKGWFALEAYGLTFWFATAGLVAAVRSWQILPANEAARSGESLRGEPLLSAGAFFACYFSGVIVSTALGIDLMIKTERYLLMIMPPVAMFAGYAAFRFTAVPWTRGAPERLDLYGRLDRYGRQFVLVALSAMFIAHIAVLVRYRQNVFNLNASQLALPLESKLNRWGPFAAIRLLRDSTPTDAVVLSFKPSDMFYSQRKMISFLDPRLLAVYRASSPDTAARMLSALDVQFVHLPNYAFPPFYRTAIHKLMADPARARLSRSLDGYQVYELQHSSSHLCGMRDVGPAAERWTWEGGYVFGGRKRLFQTRAGSSELAPRQLPDRRPVLFQRDHSISLKSPPLAVTARGVGGACPPASEVFFSIDLVGKGYANLYVEHLDQSGYIVAEEALGGTEIGPDQHTRTYSRRFLLRPGASQVRLVVEYRGVARIGVDAARLASVQSVRPGSTGSPYLLQ